MNNMFYVLITFIFLTYILVAFMPYWTRKSENFGVSIPESMYNRPDFKAMRKKYTTSLIVINIILFLLLIVARYQFQENTVMMLFIIVTFVYLLFTFILYLPFHNKMKRIKQSENWNQGLKQTIVIDPKFREEKLTYSNGWFLIPVIISIFTITFTWVLYDNFPLQIPTHTSFTGKVTYQEKSIGTVFMLPFTQLFLIGIFFVINYIIKNSKQQISSTRPDVSRLQNIIFRKRWSLYLIVTASLMALMFLFLQLTMIYQSLLQYQDVVIFSVIGIILLGTIILSVTTGQGGSRVKIPNEESKPQIERDDDRHWKLGQFYFNKNDPSIFVEKRFGIGWTNNWAHPASWMIIIIILGLGIGIPILLNKF